MVHPLLRRMAGTLLLTVLLHLGIGFFLLALAACGAQTTSVSSPMVAIPTLTSQNSVSSSGATTAALATPSPAVSTSASPTVPPSFSPALGLQLRPPPPPAWELEQAQTLLENAEGRFSLELIMVSHNQLLFFYTFRPASTTPSSNLLKAEVSFTAGKCPQATNSASTTSSGNGSQQTAQLQPLGRMSQFQVGVIKAEWEDHPGQVVSLTVTSSPSLAKGKQLSRQLAPDKGTTNQGYYLFSPSHYHDPSLAGPMGGFKSGSGESYVTAFRIVMLEPANRHIPPLFVQIDQAAKVSLLTEAEYQALVGLPVPSLPVSYTTPYPPATATPPGYTPASQVRCS